MKNKTIKAGNVAIVTGGSQGLGKALARELLSCGMRVVIDARDSALLEAARRELHAFGEIVAVPGDVTDKLHVHELFASALGFGRLDLLVNNASTLGAVPLPRVEQLEQKALARIFEVNVFAPVHLMQHALRAMRRGSGEGTIVNITSDAATQAYPTWGGYASAKAALEQLSAVVASELEGSRMRVLVADPGDMNTQMHRDALPDADPGNLRDPADSARALLDAITQMHGTHERVQLQISVPA